MDLLAALASYRASVKGCDPLETTQIEFINLGPLRDRYGARWPKVRERIFDVCQAFIERRVGRGDLVMRAATGFMVLPGPDRMEARSAMGRCADMNQLAAALECGVRHISGPAIGAAGRTIPAPYPLQLAAAHPPAVHTPNPRPTS